MLATSSCFLISRLSSEILPSSSSFLLCNSPTRFATFVSDLHSFVYAVIDFPLKDHQRYWISEYSQLTISIPKDREEQTAIATILTDMDKEIADLEAKRDKYSLLKSGMMQKLLTGQIRLKINRI